MTFVRILLGALASLTFVNLAGATDHFAAPNGTPLPFPPLPTLRPTWRLEPSRCARAFCVTTS